MKRQQIEVYWEPADPATVRAALAIARERGQLVSARPHRTPGGLLGAHVVLRAGQVPPRPQTRVRRWSRGRVWLAVAGCLGVLGGFGAGVWVALAVVAWVSEHAVAILGAVGVLAGMVLLAGAASGGGGGPKPGHCSGPGTGH